jgi:hypothetical protein
VKAPAVCPRTCPYTPSRTSDPFPARSRNRGGPALFRLNDRCRGLIGSSSTVTESGATWKGGYFPAITHDFQTLALHRVAMMDLAADQYGQKYTRLTDDGFPKYSLTDHDFAEGLLLRIAAL